MQPSHRILILEDDDAISSLMSKALTRVGFGVKCVSSVSAFDELLEPYRPQVCLIDVTLPDGSGLAVLRDLAERNDLAKIVVSGQSSEVDRVIGLELGADDYICKPFSLRELRARVKAVVRRTSPPALGDQQMVLGKWVLQVGARRLVAPNGSAATLTPTEGALLELLAHNPGKTLTRDQIIAGLRGAGWAISPRAMDSTMSRIRRKVRETGETDFPIRTVWGTGYVFDGNGNEQDQHARSTEV
jgi:DNA-binding response OmpR family regulator